MAIAATDFVSFLLGWTAYYFLLLEVESINLDAIGLPQHLRHGRMDDEHFAQLRNWADPNLPDLYPNPYKRGYEVKESRRLFGAKRDAWHTTNGD